MSTDEQALAETDSFRQRIINGAVERDARRSLRRRTAGDILRLSPSERMGELIEIDQVDAPDGPAVCFAAEVISRKGDRFGDRTEETLWAIAVAGKRVPERFYNLDCALLAIVAYRHNGANMNDRGWSFAARALGVSMEVDAPEAAVGDRGGGGVSTHLPHGVPIPDPTPSTRTHPGSSAPTR